MLIQWKVAAALVLSLVASVGWYQERGTASRLEDRIIELEIHDCGLAQHEDYSVSFQKRDAVRAACVAAMRKEN